MAALRDEAVPAGCGPGSRAAAPDSPAAGPAALCVDVVRRAAGPRHGGALPLVRGVEDERTSSRSGAAVVELPPSADILSAQPKPVVENASPPRDFVRSLVQHGGSLLQNLQRRQLGRLVLFEDVLQREPVQSPRRYQAPVILRDLDLEPVVREAATPRAVGRGDKRKGGRIHLGKCDYI
ncbi:hypothetical protein Trco_003561 [Trichoderma cornu-damae]|uniref:Uncharacterized protein n=1 Tax=Trichoderma cornu-damae TaxID=654480 RepID=A0A9P8QQ99_9HYPO|nr:hypothetical protein Trco_003561 [Trichoderma cornu-damae]